MRLLVVGSCIVDFIARPTSRVQADASNEGDILWGAGGAGRNVAENLTRLGARVTLVTDAGDDFLGRFLLDGLSRLGIETRLARKERTGVYIALLQPDGSLEKGFCANGTPLVRTEEAMAVLRDLGSFQGAVLDANLNARTINGLAAALREAGIPYALETVSPERSRHVLPAISGCAFLKPDRGEATALTGLPCGTVDEACACARALLAQGARRAMVSLGPEGFVYADAQTERRLRAAPATVRDVTGAGDALFTAVFYGFLQGLPLDKVLEAGRRAAALACATAGAVSPSLGPGVFHV